MYGLFYLYEEQLVILSVLFFSNGNRRLESMLRELKYTSDTIFAYAVLPPPSIFHSKEAFEEYFYSLVEPL